MYMSTNGQELEHFNPNKLMDGVKERIKSTFVSLIPDEVWSSMIERELYIFTTGKIIPHHEYTGKSDKDGNPIYKEWEERVPYSEQVKYNDWGRIEKPAEVSPLSAIIREELHKKFREDFEKFLHSEEYQMTYDKYGKPVIAKAIEDILIKNSDTIFYNMVSSLMQKHFDEMRYKIMSETR